MSSIFDDLKKFAISDILSVSGKDKTAKVIENHVNILIEVAFIEGEKLRQFEVEELQKRIDMAIEHIEDYYGVVGLSMVVDILNGDQ